MRWRYTFGKRAADFCASDGAYHVGRIYRDRGCPPSTPSWTWIVNGIEVAHAVPVTLMGQAATKREAVAALRQAWARATAWSAETGTPLGMGDRVRPP